MKFLSCTMAAIIVAVLAANAASFKLVDQTETVGGSKLRGFGKCDVCYETWRSGSDAVNVMRFSAQSADNAETVIGKFLHDLSWNEGIEEKDAIFITKSGPAFAVAKNGTQAAIYSAEKAADILAFFNENAGMKAELVRSAKCPEWMKRFEWGTYGMGGLESFHDWMKHAGAKPGEQLDPREDFEFLKQMGPMHFDNWLQLEGMDNCDGITSANGIYWKAKYAEENGIPYAYRTYMPCNGWAWENRRFADKMEKPAKFMLNGWLRYGTSYQPHMSWYQEDMWNYIGFKTYEQMKKFKTDKVRGWMHPAGELVHQPWYDMHSDYSPAAKADWIDYLKKNGVTLEEASAMYSRGDDGFVSWDQVEVPEFATFAGLPEMVLDLAGTWFSSPDRDKWDAIAMPGNWDYMKYYNTEGRNSKSVRYMRRSFDWDSSFAAGKRAYLYFFPMSGANIRHKVFLNGKEVATIGRWCALDLTDLLKQGSNEIEFELHDHFWNGRVFFSTQPPAVYPNLGKARNKMFALWNNWRRDAKMRRCEAVFDAMRQADPDSPIKFMAPIRFGTPITDKLMYEWGAFAHFTGEGVWYFPWYKRYGKLWGYQGTSELAGPYNNVKAAKLGLLRTFLAGLNMHEPVFLTQAYSRNEPVREWWLQHKPLLQRMGKYDIFGPQVLLYRRSLANDDSFPAPEPLVGAEGHRVNTPWDWDIGRGSLQSLGQSMLYIDDDGITAGKMYGYKLMVDCGNEVMDSDRIAEIADWVKSGGTFIAYPFSGRSTVTEGDAWPISALTGAKAAKLRDLGGKVTWNGNTYEDNGRTVDCNGNNLNDYSVELEPTDENVEVIATYENGKPAATMRKLGRGRVIWLGSAFWRDSADIMGIWWPGDIETEFWKTMLANIGFDSALCETDTKLVWAQPYRSNDGSDFVTCLCNFNTNDVKNVTVTLRTPRKPGRLVAYGADGVTYPDFKYDNGICRFSLPIEYQDVKVVNACGVYAPEDAARYWWKENQIAWHELKPCSRDFTKYTEGRWKDPTQDLKTGWKLADGRDCVADVLQFWGVLDGEGAVITKTFDIDDADWFKGGVTRLICGSWVGPNFMSPAKITLNGEVICEKTKRDEYIEKDVSNILKPTGNVMEMAFEKASEGRKFTGLTGTIHLYHRAYAERSFTIDKLPKKLFVPAEWEGKYKVFFYMQGKDGVAKPPLGVKVADRYSRKHHHNFGTITDVDVTSILKFGEDNVLVPVGNAPNKGWDWSKFEVRIDLLR